MYIINLSLVSCACTFWIIVFVYTGAWIYQETTGEKPPGLSGHTLTLIDEKRAVLFGGFDGKENHNDAYVLDMETWV